MFKKLKLFATKAAYFIGGVFATFIGAYALFGATLHSKRFNETTDIMKDIINED